MTVTPMQRHYLAAFEKRTRTILAVEQERWTEEMEHRLAYVLAEQNVPLDLKHHKQRHRI